LTVLAINMCWPSLRQRRVVAGMMGRRVFVAYPASFTAEGLEHAAEDTLRGRGQSRQLHRRHCDRRGIAARVAFVIKKEMVRVPLAGLLLRVSVRNSRAIRPAQGATDARRVLSWRLPVSP